MKKRLFLLLGMVSILFMSGCVNNTNNKAIIKVGMIAPLGNIASTYGEDAVNVKQDAIDQFNRTHKNINVKLIVENGNCEGVSASSAVQKLINVDKVAIIMGGSCSSETLSAGKIANKKHTILFSSFASAPAISELGPYIFRFWNDAYAIQKLARFVSKRNHTIALIYEKTDYAEAMANEFKKRFKGTIRDVYSYQSNEKDFDILIKQIQQKGSTIDGIVFFTQDEASAVSLVKTMDKYGILKSFYDNIYSAYWFNSPLFLSKVGNIADGLIEVNVDTSIKNPRTKKFLEQFKQKHDIKSLDIEVISEQEGVSILLDCIDKGSTTSQDFKQCLDAINSGHLHQGYFNNPYYFNTSGDAVGIFDFIIEKVVKGKIEIIQ